MPNQDSSRFETSKRILWIDRMMNFFISSGGVSIILAVLGIFVFIFSQIFPLFTQAEIKKGPTLQVRPGNYQLMGMDEWGELPFLVNDQGELTFVDVQERSIHTQKLNDGEQNNVQAVDYHVQTQTLVLALAGEAFRLVDIKYEPKFSGKKRKISSSVFLSEKKPLFLKEFASEETQTSRQLSQIKLGMNDDFILLATVLVPQEAAEKKEVWATLLAKEENLLGESNIEWKGAWNLTDQISGNVQNIRVNESGDILLVTTEEGFIHYFKREEDTLKLRQSFQPFAELSSPEIQSIDFILGGVSIYLVNESGENVLYSLYLHEDPKTGIEERLFGQTKTFPLLKSPPSFFDHSLRNKAFLIGNQDYSSLRYATTEKVRWESSLPFQPILGSLSRKYHKMAFLDKEQRLYLYDLKDPHPEGGWKAFFGKIWYEGASKPDYTWQSTGGSDSFESKLSLVPLIFGTLKGTFYALIFSVPVALLAALYTSQFLQPQLKKIVKPTMEIMASLPSVILGFLAALWLAPLIEEKIPSLILIFFAIPLCAWLAGYFLSRVPIRYRKWIPRGQEWLTLIPLLLVVIWFCWELGPILEKNFFIVTDAYPREKLWEMGPILKNYVFEGERVADFRLWWPQVTGTPFEQRNSLVVGFIMGFAVIPIIFTIAEDSLAAVPQSLRSASLALGASRWQTAFYVMLPAATAGIFSAIMIGIGRAVGETMIVLMATGNTPIMEWNIFSGMRTLSANLAVELPEAPLHSTLYRTLYLGAFVLFIMTFLLNSIAEIMRHRIRKKFKAL
ncbi:MAG: ABC transporter permease subunit [Deltaproteobacteria bacterium]|nr:ABC transporter permease subunit [Deltaproteobacteria bacterium]